MDTQLELIGRRRERLVVEAAVVPGDGDRHTRAVVWEQRVPAKHPIVVIGARPQEDWYDMESADRRVLDVHTVLRAEVIGADEGHDDVGAIQLLGGELLRLVSTTEGHSGP